MAAIRVAIVWRPLARTQPPPPAIWLARSNAKMASRMPGDKNLLKYYARLGSQSWVVLPCVVVVAVVVIPTAQQEKFFSLFVGLAGNEGAAG